MLGRAYSQHLPDWLLGHGRAKIGHHYVEPALSFSPAIDIMARRLTRAKALLLAIVATVGTVYFFKGSALDDSYIGRLRTYTWKDPQVNVTAEGAWFPAYDDRIVRGESHVFRNPEVGGVKYDGVIDEVARRTFYILKSGADVMWQRLPVHLETTLKRWPHHQLYADGAAQIGAEQVLDCIAMLPNEVKHSDQLKEWQVRNDAIAHGFGWDYTDVKIGEKGMGWMQDRFKNLPALFHAYLTAPATMDWFIMADDDTYIMSQSIGSIVRDLDPKDKYYIGSKARCQGYLAEHGRFADKMKANEPDAERFQTFAHGGSGIVMSRGLLDALFQDKHYNPKLMTHYSKVAMETLWGDALLGYVLREELGIECNDEVPVELIRPDPFQGNTVFDTHVPGGNFCQSVGSFHHLKPVEIQTLFEWEDSLIERKPNTLAGALYADYYHDFVLPYVVEEREAWDNGASEVNFFNLEPFSETDLDMVPGESPANCSYTCEVYVHCMMWRWAKNEKGESVCGCSMSDVARGVSKDTSGGKDEGSEFVSGWKIDRIRSVRSASECDPVHKDADSKSFNDDDGTSEGWYVRRLESELFDAKPADWVYDWEQLKLVDKRSLEKGAES